ncbi:HD domain-containing protein [Flavobacteriaceae bacterium D16]|nr:HD domain-containing protein [Flavobacteriaceae bacterium D16]
MELLNKRAYPKVCFEILEELSEQLPDFLTYHSIDHSIDVANVCNNYIEFYKIEKSLAKLIRIAAVSHDYGYLFSPKDHEERSIVEITPRLEKNLSQKEIRFIAGMIRATKIPQNPQNFYQEIVADADLDYLGREDYNKWSERLYKEFQYFGVVKTHLEWLDVQIKFLENHSFHTDLAKENRCGPKKRKLQELIRLKKLSDSSV